MVGSVGFDEVLLHLRLPLQNRVVTISLRCIFHLKRYRSGLGCFAFTFSSRVWESESAKAKSWEQSPRFLHSKRRRGTRWCGWALLNLAISVILGSAFESFWLTQKIAEPPSEVTPHFFKIVLHYRYF